MPCLHLSLFGGFAGHAAGGEEIAFATRKVRALAAYLAATAQAHRRERLASLLWPEQSEGEARANLRKTLSRLRQALPAAARGGVVASASEIALRQDLVDVDSVRFDRLVADGTPESLERAVALHRGPFLEGFDDCGEVFEAWLVTERQRLDELHQQSLQRLLDHHVVTGAIDRAIQIGLQLVALDPLQEGVHRSLIRLYMYQDRIGRALAQYQRCREILASELGVEPAPETERVRAELLRLLPADGEPGPENDDVPERALLVEAASMERRRRRADLSGGPSIAVLSFAGSDDATVPRHLGDGIAEDIATELGRFRELEVIAPSTALAYRAVGVPPERVGHELGTGYVLEGRLRPQGERLRTTIRLIESGSGRQLWAERYDGPQARMFDVQDEVVRRIVGTLVGRIEDTRLATARRRRPEDLDAYDLWLRGWSALKRPDLAAITEARDLFQRAVTRDPTFARAYVGLAMAHLNEWACFSWNHWVFPKREVLDLARKAVELDAHDHRAHCILGATEIYVGDYESARSRMLKALEINPNDADVLAHASWALAILGLHDLAVETGRRALRLAPHHPWRQPPRLFATPRRSSPHLMPTSAARAPAPTTGTRSTATINATRHAAWFETA
jgi:DNA-binding SARP family transcriptional activator